MVWSPRHARCALALFLFIFAAGQVKLHLGRPVYPDPGSYPEQWPPVGCLLEATALEGRALEVFTRGTTVAAAMVRIGVTADPLGSGFCLPRAGVLYRGQRGWRIRPMSQKERWIWRIPMDIYACLPEDLLRIKGIGPALAARIYDFVQARGALQSLSDLDEVVGVGRRKLDELKRELELP